MYRFLCLTFMAEKFLHALNSVHGCEWRILDRLWKRFQNWRSRSDCLQGTPHSGVWQYVWEKARADELVSAGAGEKFAERLCDLRRRFDVDAEFAALWEKDIVAVSRGNREYPKALLQLPDAPYLLYRKGARLNTHKRMMAIVGTRRPTKYGENVAYDLAEALAERDIAVVSGLAFGIDAVAHFSTVSVKKPTVAVLASGLYDITPTAHHRLSEKILEHGGSLVSEYPPNDPAYPRRFLERNRIIAGLCEAVIIVEAGQRSGALVTARLANEYNKDVYAVPGDINREQAEGCLQLLYDGANPLVSIQKFLEDYGLSSQKNLPQLTPQEKNLVKAFENKPRSTDELIEKTQLPIQTMNSLLAELELKGVIQRNRHFLWETAMTQ